ncbi:MAG: ABC transporter ATP-binding protein [Candidatus Wallbacteria bacterium]
MSTLIKARLELYKFIKPYLAKIFLSIVLLIIVSALSLMGPIIIKRLIDVDIANGLEKGIWISGAMYVAAQVGILIITFFQMFLLQKIGVSIMCDIKNQLFSHILRLPVKYFEKNPAGKLISRIESDTETLRQLFTNTAVTLFQDLLMFAGMLGVMFYLSARLTMIVLCILPFLFVGAFYIQKYLRERFKLAREKASLVTKFLSEFISGMQCVQAFNYESHAAVRMNEQNTEKKETFFKAEVLEILFHNSILMAEALTLSCVLYYGGFMAIDKYLTLGTLILFIGYIRQSFEPIIRLSEQFNIIQKSQAAAERIFEILFLEREDEFESLETGCQEKTEPNGKNAAGKIADGELKFINRGACSNAPAEFENSIEFKNVIFSYDGERNVLEDVSFKVNKGDKVALVGHTGSGKSTILSLLLRFYEKTSGQILIDGRDISDIGLSRLRGMFSLVLQDVVLFPGRIIDNIKLLKKEISAEDVKKAASAVNMLEFINGKSDGFDTEIAERGANLSMGERQLLSFARALAFNPQILLLDEATSSVDPHTEALIQDALLKIQKDRTSIIVAHRLSTIVNADKIIVLDAGRIAEAGTHSELLEKGGIYKKLYERQSRAHLKNDLPFEENVKNPAEAEIPEDETADYGLYGQGQNQDILKLNENEYKSELAADAVTRG